MTQMRIEGPSAKPPSELVEVDRKSFGKAMAYGKGGDDCPENEDGGRSAFFEKGAARLGENDELLAFATAAELKTRGEDALWMKPEPIGPLLAIDRASAGTVIVECYSNEPTIEHVGYTVVTCPSGIAILDRQQQLLTWLPEVPPEPKVHTCPHCKCTHT